MAQRGDGLGPMGAIIATVVGVVVIIALYAFVPTIGMQIESSTTVPSTSVWGLTGTAGQAFVNGSELWGQVSSLPVLSILAIFVALAIGYFVMIGRR